MYKGKCKRCRKNYEGSEGWHRNGYCCWAHQIQQIDDNMDRIAEKIGHSLGEVYNPEFHHGK